MMSTLTLNMQLQKPITNDCGNLQLRTNENRPHSKCHIAKPGVPNYFRIKNWKTGNCFYDTLHKKSDKKRSCSKGLCLGSVMLPKHLTSQLADHTENTRSVKIFKQAADFLHQYYTSIRRCKSNTHIQRLQEVEKEIVCTGTYQLVRDELVYSVKQAWRNAARCVGRIQWSKLEVFDARNCSTAEEMFLHICNHLKFATNKGNIRSAITVFPQRMAGRGDFRLWNSQLLRYAGYAQPDGSVIGDPANVEFTELCIQMGWKAPGGRFDILPLVVQAQGEPPKLFNLPPELIMEVPIIHPIFPWFSDLGLRWYAVPAVANMMLEVGGLEFTAVPFNGWYMGTEIGTRNFCDSNRYNILEDVARKMELDIKKTSSLWKDKAMVEINIAVLHSYQQANVTIMDHHTATESFMQHMNNEHRERGGCPADWVWIVPPMSGSLTPVFHQEMLNYVLTPSFMYQVDPWKEPCFSVKKKTSFRIVAQAVMFITSFMSKTMKKRVKVQIVYASETGRSQTYAALLKDIFKTVFNPQVVCMDSYELSNLEHEKLVLVVTSTFGNGDSPDNGKTFARTLQKLTLNISKPQESSRLSERGKTSDRESSLSSSVDSTATLGSFRFSVFGLGSRAYQNFCAFAHTVDTHLEKLGGKRILEMGEGDEQCGQDEAFQNWAKDVFRAACASFCIGEDTKISEEEIFSSQWEANKFRVVMNVTPTDLTTALSKLHKKKVLEAKVISAENLQSNNSSRTTLLVKLDTNGQEDLQYQPGDHLSIYPTNPEDLVQAVLACVSDPPRLHDTIIIETLKKRNEQYVWVPEDRLPPCTLLQALSHLLDLSNPPSSRLLQLLAQQTPSEQEQQRLHVLSQGGEEYKSWCRTLRPTMMDVLREFPSVSLPCSLLLSQLPLLQPRYYSISSSQQACPGEIHATVAVVQYRTCGDQGPLRFGICSNWLNNISPGQKVPCFVRRSQSFHLPADHSVPCILVGPGTGIAPFRSFWQQRLYEIEHLGMSPGKLTLMFGCRHYEFDHIYKKEVEDAKKRRAISAAYTAYSRTRPSTEDESSAGAGLIPPCYVQHILQQQGEEVCRTLCRDSGHMYVCGDVSMARDVLATVQQILMEHGAMSDDQAKDFLSTLKGQRYHEDIFGVTLHSNIAVTASR